MESKYGYGIFLCLPCDTGRDVYYVFENAEASNCKYEVFHGKVESFSYDAKHVLWVYVVYDNGLTYWHEANKDFDKVLFLDMSEAAAIAKKLNAKKGK